MAEIDRSLLGVWGPESTMRVETGKIREFATRGEGPEPRVLADDGAARAAHVPDDDRPLDRRPRARRAAR